MPALHLLLHLHAVLPAVLPVLLLQVNTSSVVLKKLMEGREGEEALGGSADVAARWVGAARVLHTLWSASACSSRYLAGCGA